MAVLQNNKDNAEKALNRLSEQLTRLQKGIDKPHAVFKKIGRQHYAVKFEVEVARGR